MDIRVDDELKMKKPHACGCDRMVVLRAGMDFKLCCLGCSHTFFITRPKLEKSFRLVFRGGQSVNVKPQNSTPPQS